MRFVEPLYPDWRILSVVTVNIQLEPVAYTLRVDSGNHSFFPFVEQGQYRIIHIVVNQRNGAFCLSYQVRYKTVSVKHLPVVEYTLHGRNIGFQSFEHLVDALVRHLLMPFHFKLMIFNRFKPLEQLGIGNYKTAHGHKGSHDADVHLSMAIPCSVKA